MGKKGPAGKRAKASTRPNQAGAADATALSAPRLAAPLAPPAPGRPSALLDTRVIYCGDCLEQLRNLPAACVDLIYIDPLQDPSCAGGRTFRVRMNS